MKITRDGTGTPVELRMQEPADMHEHLRQDALLETVVQLVNQRFAYAIVMPNTTPIIASYEALRKYAGEIRRAKATFKPLMTMYLTDALDPHELRLALELKEVAGVKYYPRGLTTNSDSGVKDPSSLWTKGTRPHEVLQELAQYNAVLLLHAADGIASAAWQNDGRSYNAGDELDPYDQEPHFILETLIRIIDAHPNLKISVEHLSTAIGAEFMRTYGGKKLGCSLTAHHLLLDRRDVFRGGFRPHRFWWPIIQPREHREELRKFAAEDHPFVWFGSDSAPHPVGKKEAPCCSGGVLMAHAGIELPAEAFEDMGALDDRFERFASINGPRFYGLEPSGTQITLVREEWEVKPLFIGQYVSGGGYAPVVPFRLGEKIRWKLAQ